MKQKLRSTLVLLLLVCILLPTFVSCSQTQTPATSDTTAGENPESSGDESTTSGNDSDSETTVIVDPNSPILDLINANGKTRYVIIQSDKASNTITAAVMDLFQTLKTKTGVSFGLGNDWYNAKHDTLPVKACEILVGETNRPESQKAKALLREKDFIICEENDRIVILGGCEQKTLEALDYFIENYCDASKKNVSIPRGLQVLNRHVYNIDTLKIDGVDIMNYHVVTKKSDEEPFAYYAALNFIDYIYAEAGIKLTHVYDSEPETAYELVIGNTNRVGGQSANAVPLQGNEYILRKSGNSVYMVGSSYMVGAGVSDLINNYIAPKNNNHDINVTGLPESNEKRTFVFPEKATSGLLLIGDGMGQNHVETVMNLTETFFLAGQLDNIATCSTYSYSVSHGSASYTDSAASATALATGYKTKNKYLGLDPSKRKIQNVRELASAAGALTGILTTDTITGATPAGFLCHHADRNDSSTLLSQIQSLQKTDKNLLCAIGLSNDIDALLPEARNMLYTLSSTSETFFSMIEEAQIDKRSHNNNMSGVVTTVKNYNALIGYCIQFVMIHPETALIITADHECGGITYDKSSNKYVFTSKDHTNAKVPVYAVGAGTDYFKDATIDNTDIAKFLAAIFSDKPFGDQNLVPMEFDNAA